MINQVRHNNIFLMKKTNTPILQHFNPAQRGSITPIFILVCFLFLSCASSQKTQKQDGVRAPKQEKAEVSKKKEAGKQKEENKLYHPGRNKKAVMQGIEKAVPDIKEALTDVISIYEQKDTITLKFYITPGGALDLIGFVESVTLDSVTMKDLTESVNKQVLDPIDKSTFTKVTIQTFLDENKAVTLSDKRDIDYVEIRQLTDILIIVNMNSGNIVRAYSKRWAEKPNLEGRITVKFGIDDKGDVVSCKVIGSTINDSPLEEQVIKNVKSWKFGAIYNPGDVTEVVYPFNFSQ